MIYRKLFKHIQYIHPQNSANLPINLFQNKPNKKCSLEFDSSICGSRFFFSKRWINVHAHGTLYTRTVYHECMNISIYSVNISLPIVTFYNFLFPRLIHARWLVEVGNVLDILFVRRLWDISSNHQRKHVLRNGFKPIIGINCLSSTLSTWNNWLGLIHLLLTKAEHFSKIHMCIV